MGELERKGIREVSSWAIGIAATVFTAIASMLGALHELGYLGTKQTAAPAPVAVVTVVAPPLPAANVEDEAAPHHHHHHPMAIAANAPTSNQQLASSETPTAPAVAPPSIEGAWRDSFLGTCHLLTLNGSAVTIVTYNPFNGHPSVVGEGTYSHRVLQLKFKNHKGEMIEYELHLGPEGKRLTGFLQRPGETRRAQWHYTGTSCTK
jgi:hypothetical protein